MSALPCIRGVVWDELQVPVHWSRRCTSPLAAPDPSESLWLYEARHDPRRLPLFLDTTFANDATKPVLYGRSSDGRPASLSMSLTGTSRRRAASRSALTKATRYGGKPASRCIMPACPARFAPSST